jgi:hypothetical protein
MTMLQIVPLLISFAALGASLALGLFALRDRRLTIRLSREADIKGWIKDMEGIYMNLQSDSPETRRAALNRLHLAADIGRLFFPNDQKKRRSAVLDPLIETFQRCEAGDFDLQPIREDWRTFIDCLMPQTTAFKKGTSPELLGERQYKNKG